MRGDPKDGCHAAVLVLFDQAKGLKGPATLRNNIGCDVAVWIP